VTAYEEPPVVELEELLDEQTEHAGGRTAGQIALIVALTAVGLVAVSTLAVLLIPAGSEFVKWIAVAIRFGNGG
jgi:hypothetical protein